MAENETVTATWRGPFTGLIGTPSHHVAVEPGETVEIPIDQARDSAHWEIEGEAQLPARDEHLSLDELNQLGRKELQQIAADRDVTVKAGTGKDGAIVKSDLAQAIFDAQDGNE